MPLPPFLPPLPGTHRPPPGWFHCCRMPARLATHCRAAAAAGVSGAARPFKSGRVRATCASPVTPKASPLSGSCLTCANFRLRVTSGLSSSSCSCASCSSKVPPPRSSWASSPSAPSSSSSPMSSREAATMVRPVQLMICSSCFEEKYLAAPSRASAKASDSAETASAKAARNFFMLKTRKTRQLSKVALDLFCSGICRNALVTKPTSGSSSTRPSSLGFTTAAFVTGALVGAASHSESSSNKQGVSPTVSTRICTSIGAETTISS
mmetsp:Transcript_37932/g.105536  ORF Transcript_37932/g.105536 Transcript_37932/m.105536 type:complete len:266 (+) Transcript_37932:229-1026(+)